MPKGEHAGAVIVEASSAGRDGDVVILTACADGAIVGATVKKQTESYWNKLPEDLFDALVGKKLTQTVNMKDELKQISADVHASYSMDAVSRAVNLSATFAAENGVGIEQYIEQTKGGDGQ